MCMSPRAEHLPSVLNPFIIAHECYVAHDAGYGLLYIQVVKVKQCPHFDIGFAVFDGAPHVAWLMGLPAYQECEPRYFNHLAFGECHLTFSRNYGACHAVHIIGDFLAVYAFGKNEYGDPVFPSGANFRCVFAERNLDGTYFIMCEFHRLSTPHNNLDLSVSMN